MPRNSRRPGRHRAFSVTAGARYVLVLASALALVVLYLLVRPGRVYDTGPAHAGSGRTAVQLLGEHPAAPVALQAGPRLAPQALGATTNYFSGYDLTQATVCCGGGWASAPWVSAASYYNATMNSRTNLAHDASASISSYYTLQVAIGQVVGLMCWTQTSTGTYWEKADSRHTVNGASNLYIAYLADNFVNVSRAALFTYVPRCSSTSATELDRLVKRALAGVVR